MRPCAKAAISGSCVTMIMVFLLSLAWLLSHYLLSVLVSGAASRLSYLLGVALIDGSSSNYSPHFWPPRSSEDKWCMRESGLHLFKVLCSANSFRLGWWICINESSSTFWKALSLERRKFERQNRSGEHVLIFFSLRFQTSWPSRKYSPLVGRSNKPMTLKVGAAGQMDP